MTFTLTRLPSESDTHRGQSPNVTVPFFSIAPRSPSGSKSVMGCSPILSSRAAAARWAWPSWRLRSTPPVLALDADVSISDRIVGIRLDADEAAGLSTLAVGVLE